MSKRERLDPDRPRPWRQALAYDITAGLMYGKLGCELGYVPDL